MSGVVRMLAVAVVALSLVACNTMKVDPAQQSLVNGVKQYEEGDFIESADLIQGALSLGLSSKNDQVTAYKYLAFIHCISRRERQCRDAFRKALEIDPTFDLKPAEAGHPLWGPVFRGAKAKSAK